MWLLLLLQAQALGQCCLQLCQLASQPTHGQQLLLCLRRHSARDTHAKQLASRA
jgi:hypothetical protein